MEGRRTGTFEDTETNDGNDDNDDFKPLWPAKSKESGGLIQLQKRGQRFEFHCRNGEICSFCTGRSK